MYPLIHVHCDDEQVELARTLVHSEVDIHSMPTTAETVKWRTMVHNMNHDKNSSFFLTKEVKCAGIMYIPSV